MEKFDSITHFLQSGGFNYRVFDMGRKVIAIANDKFQAIEDQESQYPYPFQQKAWLALLFWKDKDEDNAVIWFLQFPVDELGFLKQEARDHFLIDLLEQTGKNIQAKQSGDQPSDELNESPFSFKPNLERLAMLHALAGKTLEREPSRYYQATREYLGGKLGYEQWQFLGVQGITDVVARLSEDENSALLQKAVLEMPTEPLLNFCYALENQVPQGLLTDSLLIRLNSALQSVDSKSDVALVAGLIRALSSSQPHKKRKQMLLDVMSSSFSSEIEVLAAISGRTWKDLVEPEVMICFIDCLAVQEQAAFNAILVDLMMIPGMKEPVLAIMRSSDRSELLGNKLSGFMQGLQGV